MPRSTRPTLVERTIAFDGSLVEARVPARLVRPLSARHVKQLAAWGAQLKDHDEEDAGWDWPEILRECRSDAKRTFDTFGLVCRRELQGALVLRWQGDRSRITGVPVVYVEYIASAPWNRPMVSLTPRFKGVGSVLIKVASDWSASVGGGGALALHSKPRALGFYVRAGFRDLGPDAEAEGLHYMELLNG